MTPEEAFSDDLKLRLDETTRQRITKLSLERKKSIDSKQRQKLAALSAAGKWASPLDDDYHMFNTAAGIEETSDQARNIAKRKKHKPKKSDDMSISEHTGRASKESHGADQEEENGYNDHDTSRVVGDGDNEGKLENFLGQMNNSKPIKKREARTVASMPASTGSNARKEVEKERRGRSKSPHALKKRVQGSGESSRRSDEKERSESLGPMKDRSKRHSSQGQLKKRAESVGPIKKRSDASGTRSRRESMGSPEGGQKGRESNTGKLGELLGNMDASSGKKKSGTRSVASAPTVVRKEKRPPRRQSRGPISGRMRMSTTDHAADKGERTSNVQPRRTKSVDNSDIEEMKGSRQNLSQRLSKGLQSFRKMAGLASDKTATTHPGDSSSMEQEQAPRRNGRDERRESVRSKKKRSNSAGPLMNREVSSPKKEKIDRRAAMSKIKRNNSMQPNSHVEESELHEQSNRAPIRAQSMMLHREATRRGKANSLKDLVNYSEEEIHSTSYFASNHVLVNRERMKRGLRPLTRNIAMDELARSNAARMADSGGVAPIQATYVGNVLRGESIRAIHRATMQNREGRERANLLNPYFQEFGVGTHKGKDGMLYICQLFSERLELTITDTTG